ncbi:SGNH/GDSL hydrolase family protein [Curtobacterium sp. P97]|uniref:SGNH/GDSL hydrolase family protein n=1 Tax=Curtobacterium sp. P97 TaxID=2939562 RepID=UPI0020423B0A|nr:SGNH/GDSL hydrolase family protein [Curtobacterium sp. P97]MCM3521975.1 SGNH/GDSL hydrolase family protein [Curtobacterium sp. P97]
MGNGFVGWFSRSYKGIIIALVAVMAVTLVFLAVQQVNASKPAAGAEPLPAPTYTRMKDPRPVAAFLGDSYTAGKGASAPADRWVNIVADVEDWQVRNDGAGGTGYAATASLVGCGKQFCDNYVGRIGDVVKQKPDIVVVAGGQNDFGLYLQDRSAVEANITKTFDQLREQLPNARIIAVGPSTTTAVASHVLGLDAAVQAAAASVDATYVSLIDPNVIDPAWVLPDGGHVNDEGHAAIAKRVEEGLK